MSYDNVVSLADEELETLAAVKGATAVVAAEREPLVAIGLIGTDTSVDLGAAAAAYRAGHLGEARDDAAAAEALIDGAEAIGTQRATVAGGAALAVSVVGLGIVILVVRRRRSRVTAHGARRGPCYTRRPDGADGLGRVERGGGSGGRGRHVTRAGLRDG